jgi:two-component system, cell cycle sensor histidine kinase and response regulator CckA
METKAPENPRSPREDAGTTAFLPMGNAGAGLCHPLMDLAEVSDDVFWVMNAARERFLFVSPSYEKLWGRPRERLLVSAATWYDAIVPEDRARIREAAVSRLPLGTFDEEYRLHRADGEERWVRDRGFVIRESNGEIARFVGVARDITFAKLQGERRFAAQRVAAISGVADGVAHDLNNILTPVLMGCGMLREKLPDPSDLEVLTLIEASARRGADVIRQMLAFSRGVTGDRVTVQPRRLLKDVANFIRATFPPQIMVAEHIPRDLHTLSGDTAQLYEAILNLCVNAREAMPTGGSLILKAANVVLGPADVAGHEVAKPGPHVAITVSDTGAGIPSEIAHRIFDPFFSTKTGGKDCGLGLSTVLGIVRSHGGMITVASEPGAGAAFTIHLPAVAEDEPPAPTISGTPAPGQGETILVIDDEDLIRTVTRRTLERAGYRVLSAADGNEGLAIYSREWRQVAVVVTDMAMPVMGGAACIAAIHQINPAAKIIGSSGMGAGVFPGDLPIARFIPKPYPAETLVAAVQELMGQHT